VALTPGETLLLIVGDESGVGEARRAARRVADEVGLDGVLAERAAIIATEAARNVVRHGRGGWLALRELEGASPGVEILAVDRGEGIRDVAAAMRDGHSTAGTPGQGLGAMRRLGSRFDVWSAPGMGTALLVEVRAGPAPIEDPVAAGICVAAGGELVSGDAWTVVRSGDRTVIAAVDGIGHGEQAHDAARAATQAVRRNAAHAPGEIVGAAHDALRSTRGAAVAVLDVRPGGAVRYAGIGNVSAAIVGDGGVRRLVSLAGTGGHEARRIQEFQYDWPAGALLVMHTDGLATQWSLASYPGLAARAPALVAAVLLRDFDRGRDDVTVLVARREGLP
jgi:anti-sigma regulatory factor (Ser/Thr protein kinase)